MTTSSAPAQERVYLGSYECYRKYIGGTIDVERSTVHVSDGTGRIAMLEVLNPSTIAMAPSRCSTRYTYSDHLQSSSMEVSEAGELISYEEYHPSGTTAFQRVPSTVRQLPDTIHYITYL